MWRRGAKRDVGGGGRGGDVRGRAARDARRQGYCVAVLNCSSLVFDAQGPVTGDVGGCSWFEGAMVIAAGCVRDRLVDSGVEQTPEWSKDVPRAHDIRCVRTEESR